jgi:ATP phosphoribosyltransferase regulatory subunit
MNGEPTHAALLPSGFRDLLPPDADAEADAVRVIGQVFASHGYERVDPPLLEFEDTLLAGSGAAVAEATFRMIDPDSHRMMGLRPDMTPQVARIAATRLANEPRPLRLAYAGPCVTLRRGQLTADRQIPQAGIELIGVDCPEADAEIVAIAAEAVAAIGLARASFDLTMPKLAPILIDAAGIEPSARAQLLRALDRKDAADVKRLGGRMASTLERLLLSSGPAPRALACLEALDLPEAAQAPCARLAATVQAIADRAPGLTLTIDPVEFRGWRYHTGVCVTVYAAGHHEELGRGGRYGGGGEGEPACGLTLFPASLLRAAPSTATRHRLYLPAGTDISLAHALRVEGYATVTALEDSDIELEARRLRCTHALIDGRPVALGRLED